MEYILFAGLALAGGQLIHKNNQILGYILIAASWIGLAVMSVVVQKSWWLGGISLVVGALFIAFMTYDQKDKRKTK